MMQGSALVAQNSGLSTSGGGVLWRSIVLVIALMAAPQAAPAQPASAPDAERAVLDALRRFVRAVREGDGPALRSLIWISEDSLAQARGRDLFADLVAARKDLERIAAQRYGEDGQRMAFGFEVIYTPEDDRALEQARISFEEGGTAARIIKDGESSPIRLRRSAAGWQVLVEGIYLELDDDPMAVLPGPDFESEMRLNRLEMLLQAIAAVTQQIESQELQTLAAAESALASRLAEATAEYDQRRASMARRWRRRGPPRFPG